MAKNGVVTELQEQSSNGAPREEEQQSSKSRVLTELQERSSNGALKAE